jgi:glycosyltransferase involved in cell wall biosynthesis
MDKLNLCHLALGVYPDRKDGAAKFERRLYDELKSRGHDISLLTAKWGEGFDDPKIVTIDTPQKQFMWAPKFAWTYYRYLKTHEYDIIQSNGSRSSLPVLMAQKPFICMIHDVGPFQTSFSRWPFIKMLEKVNARAAKRIITSAESNRAEIVHYMGAKIEKTYAVSSAIDPGLEPQPAQAEALRERWNLQGPILCYVGRLEFYKGIEDILRAYHIARQEIPDLNLVIGGKPTPTMEATVARWKREYPEVKFVGVVPDDEMAAFYSMGDAFVTYSFASEGFGLTIIEAMACGTPVIASDMPAFRDALQEYAMYVPPRNYNALAQAFTSFFHDPDHGKTLAEEARPLIAQYTWKNVGDNVERVYENYLQEFGKK